VRELPFFRQFFSVQGQAKDRSGSSFHPSQWAFPDRHVLISLYPRRTQTILDPASPFPESSPAGPLLNQVLNSLLNDFQHWFERGLDLVAHCPVSVMPVAEQHHLHHLLSQALRELAAARALRSAMTETLALDMQAMAPWHRLVMRVWALSAAIRAAGVTLPPERALPPSIPPAPPG